MVQLCQIPPPGKLQSTLRSLKMHFIPHLPDMDVTNYLRLGGAFSTALAGPTPVALVDRVPPRVLDPAPIILGPDFVGPRYTRRSPRANNRINDRT